MSKHFAPADFDSHPPELYGSVAESQREGYLPANTECLVGSPDTCKTAVYTPLRPSDEREGSNEYDYIPGDALAHHATKSNHTPGGQGAADVQQKAAPVSGEVESSKGVGSSFRSREKKVMRNSLYEDHEMKKELIHPSVCQRGGKGEGGGAVTFTSHYWRSNFVIAFFIAMAILLAVASLSVSVLVWFNINDDRSSTESTESPATDTSATVAATTEGMVSSGCGCQEDIAPLQQELDTLKMEMDSFEEAVEARQETLETNISVVLSAVDVIEARVNSSLQLPQPPPLPAYITFYNTTYAFASCNSTVSGSCELPEQMNNCTVEFTPEHVPDSVMVSSMCMFHIPDRDLNALYATMELTDGTLRCVCHRHNGPHPSTVLCQLLTTTCYHS